jgi:GH24 family phage-related lysozyme (muramidase)
MNSSKRSPDSAYSRWRVYTTLATGILIGLFYSVIASEKFGKYMTAASPSVPLYNVIDQRVLVLAFSGILGGLIYSIIVDGYVELPRFVDSTRDGVDREDGFRAGIFGDFILGLAGAFVLDFLTSPIGLDVDSRQRVLESTPIIATAAKGIIGGYGGKAILIFALEKVFKNVDRLESEKARYAEESFQQKLEGIGTVQLLDQLSEQIKGGLPEAELIKLQQDIRAASSKIKQQVFSVAEDARSAGNFSDVTRPRIERTIPVFEALRDSDPKNPEYYAQLAYSHKDSTSPDYLKSLEYISQAIKLRGDHVQGKTWRYELNRAILLIQREHERTNSFTLRDDDQEQVVQDLLSVTRYYSLTNIMEDAKRKQIPLPVIDWATNNQSFLEQREDTKSIVIQLQQQVRVTSDEDSKETEVTRTQSVTEKHDNGSSTTTVTTSKTTSIAPINQIPKQAIALIKEFESFEASAYPDPLYGWKVPTIGYGTTFYPDGRKVQEGDTIRLSQAEEYLLSYLEKRCRPVLTKISNWSRMNENQQAALYSFSYNMGDFYRGEDRESITRVCDSPERWSDRQWITEQFEKYCNPKDPSVTAGLLRRRKREAELFCKPAPDNGQGKAVGVSHASSSSSSITSGKSTATMTRFSAPALQKLIAEKHRLPPDAIARDRSLATEIQQLLIPLDLLDSPADGKFGPISTQALFEFQTLMLPKVPELANEQGTLGTQTAEALLKASPADFQPELHLANNLESRIIRYMQAKGYRVFSREREYNIVYVEGMNPDGTLNHDEPNQFNDVRMVIECQAGVPKIVGRWEGTTEPGTYYTLNPISDYAAANGVARIKFGQYKAWRVDTHGTSQPHEALVQYGTIEVHRDRNKDMKRGNDKIDKGSDFAINQHCGYNNPRSDISTASAGCLVGRTWEGHEEFMRLVKQDKRYKLNRGYMFYTTIIPGDEL